MLQRAIDEALGAADEDLRRLESRDTEGPEVLGRLKARLLTPPFLPVAATERDASLPLVSVVLPTWNRSHVIADAIESVCRQTYREWELLVVDNGSTDSTSEVVTPYLVDERVRYLRCRAPLGTSVARNHGLQHARGGFVAYVDSDNVWYPHFLQTAMLAFALDPSIDSVYGALESEEHGSKWCDVLFHPFSRGRLLKGNFIDINTVVHRRALVARHGGFDESLDRLVDWDLLLRFTETREPQRLPVLAARYRIVDSQRVSDRYPYWRNRRAVLSKWR